MTTRTEPTRAPRRLRAVAFLAAAAIGLVPLVASTSSGGAPAGHTGAPGENTCATSGCHDSFALDAGPGSLVIDAPAAYAPGDTVALEVSVDHSGAARYGFQITARAGTQGFVGAFLEDDRTRRTGTGGRWLTHARAVEDGTWTVRWIAPAAAAGPVTFYAAGNAANGNFSSTGDFIYSASATLEAGSGVSVERDRVPAALVVHGLHPNPTRAPVAVSYTLGAPGDVTLSVYDVLGRRVLVRPLGARAAGAHTEAFTASEGWAAGRYVVEVATASVRRSRAFVLVR